MCRVPSGLARSAHAKDVQGKLKEKFSVWRRLCLVERAFFLEVKQGFESAAMVCHNCALVFS